MLIRISKSNLEIKDKNLSQTKRFELLNLAMDSLEHDLNLKAESLGQIENGHQLWATTWRPIRSDDLEGLVLYYYALEIITYLKKLYPEEKIILQGNVHQYFIRYLKSILKGLYKELSYSTKFETKYRLSPLKYFKNLLFTKQGKNKFKHLKNKVWFSSRTNPDKHRFKHLKNEIHEQALIYATLDNTVNSDEGINLFDFINIKDVINTAISAKQLNQKKNKLLKNKTNLLDFALADQNTLMFWASMLKEVSLSKAIKKLHPKAILYTTANTYPPARLISRQAYLNKVPFIVVACRPMFTKSRLEERLAKIDRDKVNEAHVADAYVVWDKFSKNTLVDQGVNQKSIFVNNPSVQTTIKTKKEVFKNKWLILFSHEAGLNQKLVELLIQLKNKREIIIRQHPIQKLTNKQLSLLSQNFTIAEDITAQDYNNYEFKQVIAITINSTAVLEASQHGCGVIWLPFLNSRSIIFYEVMQSIGKVLESLEDLELFISQPKVNMQRFIEACTSSYITHFASKDQTEEFLTAYNLKN